MKDFLLSSVQNFRFERKFYIVDLTHHEVIHLLKMHPAIFREIYYGRRVNNIYFDTIALRHYYDNIDGIERRLKVRIRWYGNTFGRIENPTLELKLKYNQHVGKLQYPLKSFMADNTLSIDSVRQTFKESSLPEVLAFYLREMNFSFLNTYRRQYFLSSDRAYRITLDSDVERWRLCSRSNDFLFHSKDDRAVILEIKYAKDHDKLVDAITNFLPLRISRNSKYVTGMQALYCF